MSSKHERKEIFEEINLERMRQLAKGYNSEWDDNAKVPEDWCNDILAYVIWARQMARMKNPIKYRHRMKQIAALAVAACESYDRLQAYRDPEREI